MRGKNILWIALVAMLLVPSVIVTKVAAQNPPRMYIQPPVLTMAAAAMFTWEVRIEDAVDVYAWEFKMQANIYAFTFIAPPTEGDWLNAGGTVNTFGAYSYNSQSGVLMVGYTRVGDVPGANGAGLVAKFRLRAEVTGLNPDGSAKTWPLNLYDVRLLDSQLHQITPMAEPGDALVTIGWPAWLWDTELYLNTTKGGKIWTEWQTANLLPDDFQYGEGYLWPDQTVYCRVRNHGSAGGLYIRVAIYVMEAGWPTRGPYYTMPTYIGPGPGSAGEAITTTKLGLVDPAYNLWRPPRAQQQVEGTVTLRGRLQFSLEGWFWYWHDAIVPKLPGDGIWYNPDGATSKFKVLPPK